MTHRLTARWPAALFCAMLLLGCRSTRDAAEPAPPTAVAAPTLAVSHTTISDSLAEDLEMAALVAPYRAQLQAQVAEVIGHAAAPLTKGSPEGTLGNMAADAMLWAARAASADTVHFALTNNGGLRVPIPEGPITQGLMFELMPFENVLVVLTLTGSQVDTLAQQIARLNGEPIAGLSFKVLEDTREAFGVKVGGQPLDPEATYRVAAHDYLANGGGGMPVLWVATAREDLDVLVRDAFIDYVRAVGTVKPAFDGRITVVDEEAYLR